jgi:hypothetical protein
VFTPEHISAAFGGHALFLEGMVVIDECCPGPPEDEHGHGSLPGGHGGPS